MNINKIHRDLEEFCRKYDVLCFKYRDLHQYDENGFPIKMSEFLEESKNFFGEYYLKILLKSKIIVPYLGGGYDFNFNFDPYLKYGGSCKMQERDHVNGYWKNLIFLQDDTTDDDCHDMYHEMGHVLQYEQDLFSNKKIKENYVFSAQKDNPLNKGISSQNFADIIAYSHYLWESHANAFATACMLLRAENKKEFYQQCLKCYVRSGKFFFEALKGKTGAYHSSSMIGYYTSFPIEKEIINKMLMYRKSKQDKNFFRADGKLNVEEISLFAHDVVQKKSFFPRVFQQILDNDFKGKVQSDEKSWKPYIPEALMCRILSLANRKENVIIPQRVHENIEISYQHLIHTKSDFEELPEDDESSKLINTVCKLEETYIPLCTCMQYIELDSDKFPEISVEKVVYFGKLPRPVLESMKKKNSKYGKFAKLLDEALDKYQTQINCILKDCNMREQVYCLYSMMKRNHKIRERIWNMYYSKKENNSVEIHPEKFIYPIESLSKKDFLKMKKSYCNNLFNILRSSNIKGREVYSQKLKQVFEDFNAGEEKVSDKTLEGVSDDLYLLYYENPKVFEAAIETLTPNTKMKQNEKPSQKPYKNSSQMLYLNRIRANHRN